MEQEILKMAIQTLTETAIRAMEARQRFQAREALEALCRLRVRVAASEFPDNWRYLWRTTERWPAVPHLGCDADPHVARPLWLNEVLIESLESVLLLAAELHYASVGQDASAHLVELAEWLLKRMTAGQDADELDALVDRTIQVYEFAIDECVQYSELVLLDLILHDFRKLLSLMPAAGAACPITREHLERRLRKSAWQAAVLAKPGFVETTLTGLSPEATWPDWVRDAAGRANADLKKLQLAALVSKQ
jgi:hypothetical protein